ncbi:MAG: glycine zipper family protein [Bacteroidota bacterium]
MKKILILAACAAVMVSCKNNTATVTQAQQSTIDSLKTEIVKKQLVDSITRSMAVNVAPLPAAAETRVVVVHEPAPVKRRKSSGASQSTSRSWTANQGSNAPVAANTAYTEPAPVKEKKGWSNKAKGAVIGTGVGAVTGALVAKKKGWGALIGGAAGAGAGTGIGAILDNKKDK